MHFHTVLPEDPARVQSALKILFGRAASRIWSQYQHQLLQLFDPAVDLEGVGHARLRAAHLLHQQALIQAVSRTQCLSSPRETQAFLIGQIGHLPYETFVALFLDTRHRVIACRELFRGTIDGASVHPREVVREALACNAAAVILSHNHPSGVAEPSQADELITHRLRDALALVEIRVLDHLIVAGRASISFAERGLI